MTENPQLAKLCQVCKQVNFLAILTPREKTEDGFRALYRPELSGQGGSPSMRWGTYSKLHRSHGAADYSPRIRTVDYDTLSQSTVSNYGEPEATAFLGQPKAAEERADDLPGSQCEIRLISGESVQVKSRDVVQASKNRNDLHAPSFSEDTLLPLKPKPCTEPTCSVPNAVTEETLAAIDGEALQDKEYDRADHSGQAWFDDGGSGTDNDGDDEEENESGQESDHQPSVSTWNHSSHFTEIDRIDLGKQAEGMWDYEDGHLYYLGSIWDLRSRRHECDLCRRLWRRIRRNPDIKTKFLTKSRCIFKLIELTGRRTDESGKEVSMLNLVFIYGYKLGNRRHDNWITLAPYIFQGAHRDLLDLGRSTPAYQSIAFHDRFWGEARSRKAVCDFDLIKKWVRKCEIEHGHPQLRWPARMKIRLIDIQRNCLIKWDESLWEIPRFVALSYVWGMSRQKVMLTKERLVDFKRPGFFDQPLDQTIRDAFEVVSQIGERYLWIDALCILQDVQQDKADQIPLMDKIYGSAVLTIVAACGDDAGAGLPGVRKGTRRGNMLVLELDGIRICRRIRSNLFATHLAVGFRDNYLDLDSVYPSRAWTFQEGVLSTRVLVFTKEQVYFECERCTWCEETHWESDEVDFIGWRAIKNPTADDLWEDNFDRNAYDGPSDHSGQPKSPDLTYANIVRIYSSKILTHDDDILNACRGVLSSIEEREQSDFFHALRTEHFGNDLLFNLGRILLPRFPLQTSMECGFPSWSWLSWKGRIGITNEPRHNSADPFDDLCPWDGVKCYTLELDNLRQKTLRLLNKSGGWRFESDYIREPERGCCHLVNYMDGFEGYDHCTDVPQYCQDIALSDLQSLTTFRQLLPNFHIAFRTFATTAYLQTEDDPANKSGELAYPIRNLYVCRDITIGAKPNPTRAPETAEQAAARKTFAALPRAYERGEQIGSLPQNTPYRNLGEDMRAIPDDVYRLLWMNNNQAPTLGHLLCKPASGTIPDHDNWEGVILERVCAVRGPRHILCRHRQEEFAASWGLVILG